MNMLFIHSSVSHMDLWGRRMYSTEVRRRIQTDLEIDQEYIKTTVINAGILNVIINHQSNKMVKMADIA